MSCGMSAVGTLITSMRGRVVHREHVQADLVREAARRRVGKRRAVDHDARLIGAVTTDRNARRVGVGLVGPP